MKESKSETKIIIYGKKSKAQIVLKNYSLVSEFTVFGSPARKSNSRIYTGTAFILGKSAQAFMLLFKRQIKRIKIADIPFSRRDFFWVFEIYYNCKSADASIELIFDLMEYSGIVDNDVNIRNYTVLAEELDYVTPRVKISLYKKED